MEIQSNPLLIDIPLMNIFQYLSFRDIKRCRRVCRQWNRIIFSTILPHRAVVKFNDKYHLIQNFLKIFNTHESSSFISFKFENHNVDACAAQLFFAKWGENIQLLILDKIGILDRRCYKKQYDITQWLVHLTKLKELRIIDCGMEAPLELLRPIPSLYLQDVHILIHQYSHVLLTPLNISLTNVAFKGNGFSSENVLYHQFFDFSKAKEISISTRFTTQTNNTISDPSCATFNAQYVALQNYSFDPSGSIKKSGCAGNVHFLFLRYINFVEVNHLKMKQLLFCQAGINLCVLPQSLEKIQIHSQCTIDCGEPIQFPNLNYLCLSGENQIYDSDIIFHFNNCKNLVDLEFIVDNDEFPSTRLNLKVKLIPKSVKRLKMCGNINILDDGCIDVETLILKDVLFSNVEKIISKIKPRVLVLSLGYSVEDICLGSVLDFLAQNLGLEKVVVGFYRSQCYYSIFTQTLVSPINVYDFQKLEFLDHLDERYYPGVHKLSRKRNIIYVQK